MKPKKSATVHRRRRSAANGGQSATSTITDGDAEHVPWASPTSGAVPPRACVWLSVRQAAARAACSGRTIKRWSKAGYLKASPGPSPKGMGHLKIRIGDLEALLAGGAVN